MLPSFFLLLSGLTSLAGFSLPVTGKPTSSNRTFSGPLEKRQGLCIQTTTPVTACANQDLTTENWVAFNIDQYLGDFISAYGTADNFPAFFVQNNAPPNTPLNDFDCTTFGSDCIVLAVANPLQGVDCNFDGLEDTFCGNFVAPEAGFVVANWLSLHEGLSNHAAAVADAAAAIVKSNFINTMVSALAPKKEPIAPAVFNLIADLVTDILPIGGEIKAASTFMKKIRLVIKETKSDLKDDSKDIVSILQNNAAIDQQVTVTEEQLLQQLQNMVTGTQSRLQNILNQVFGANQDPLTFDDPVSPALSFAFLNAYHGVFLDDIPLREDLAPQMQTQLQNWIVSSVLTIMGYDVTIDTTPLFDPPGKEGTVCRAENGFTVSNGCALFRINGIDHDNGDVIVNAQQGNNIFALEDVAGLDVAAIVGAAEGCGGGQVDFDSFLDMENGDTLPRCMFNFRVAVVAL